jgi:hypothetical protein
MPEPGDKLRIVRCAQENPFHEGRIATVLAREPDWTFRGDLLVSYETTSNADGKTSKRKHYCEPAEYQSPEMPFKLPPGHPRARSSSAEVEAD